jgi:hypothetical protein
MGQCSAAAAPWHLGPQRGGKPPLLGCGALPPRRLLLAPRPAMAWLGPGWRLLAHWLTWHVSPRLACSSLPALVLPPVLTHLPVLPLLQPSVGQPEQQQRRGGLLGLGRVRAAGGRLGRTLGDAEQHVRVATVLGLSSARRLLPPDGCKGVSPARQPSPCAPAGLPHCLSTPLSSGCHLLPLCHAPSSSHHHPPAQAPHPQHTHTRHHTAMSPPHPPHPHPHPPHTHTHTH